MEDILIIDDSLQICSMLADYILPELGYKAAVTNTGRQGLNYIRRNLPALPDLILLDLQLPDISGLDLLRLLAQEGYDVPVILMTAHGSENVAVEAFRLGARNYMIKPFSETEAKTVIDRALRERRLSYERDQLTRNLQKRVQELTVLSTIGKSVSSLLDQEELLVRIVEASVYITHAEEGFLMLHDQQTDELYMRAAKNIGTARAQRMRMAVEDTLAGHVIRTGKPIRLDKSNYGSPLKIKTDFLVRSVLQVPLMVGTTAIGVLAVDNQQSDRSFTENDQYLLSTLADYAAIAIENSRLYDKIRQSEARYRDLFTNAYDAIFTLGKQLQITSINTAGTILLGYDSPMILDQPLRVLCEQASWPEVEKRFQRLLGGKTIQPFELRLRTTAQEVTVIEVSARLVDDPGTGSAIHCIARDLTERRRLEQQLLQSEKLSAIGQLVAGVAHELNNPLTSISGYTQLIMRESGLAATVHDDLRQINVQAERAAKIVQNLLMFAREHKPERRLVNLNEVITSTLSLRAYQLRVDNITVAKQFDPHLPLTVADPYQLQQVVLNLLNNAHQAMQEQGDIGVLTLRTEVIKAALDGVQPATALRLSISDTGPGISQDVMKRMFDPFYTTKPIGQGTGLGLSICFGIVREHDGHIYAQSELGKGTTMIVELPLLGPEVLDEYEAPNDAAVGGAVEVSPSRVLVVDDEEPLGQLLARLLTNLGHQPHVVQSADAALHALEQQSFDVVMTDIKMPGRSGFELHQAIVEQYPDLAPRVVFVSGDTLSPTTQAQIATIGNPFVAKPFALGQIEQLLHTILGRTPVQ